MRVLNKYSQKVCENTKYGQKSNTKYLQIDSKCVINVQKTKFTTFKDDDPKPFQTENQGPLSGYIWNENETLLKEYSQTSCKNHQIWSKIVLQKAFKSTQNALSMYKKRNTQNFRTITPICSLVRIKEQYKKVSGIGKNVQIDTKCIINVQQTKSPTF